MSARQDAHEGIRANLFFQLKEIGSVNLEPNTKLFFWVKFLSMQCIFRYRAFQLYVPHLKMQLWKI